MIMKYQSDVQNFTRAKQQTRSCAMIYQHNLHEHEYSNRNRVSHSVNHLLAHLWTFNSPTNAVQKPQGSSRGGKCLVKQIISPSLVKKVPS